MDRAGLCIARADPGSPEARDLIAQLDAALAALTGDSGAASFDPGDVQGPGATFLLAWNADGVAVGCGALRALAGAPAPHIAELKRMYARPGSGAGAPLLAALQQHALACGYRHVWLSTRRVNARAVAFYQRHGYLEVAPYGHYAHRPASICLGRGLADPPPVRRA